MNRPRITLELRESFVRGDGYLAHLIVGDERLWLDCVLPDFFAADDYHSKLAKAFSSCGIDLIEDVESPRNE